METASIEPQQVDNEQDNGISTADNQISEVKKYNYKVPVHAWQKGVSPNPGGMPRGTVSLKRTLQKLLTKEKAAEIIQTLVDMAVKEKNIKAIYLIAELTGDLGRQAQVAIQVSNPVSDPAVIERARQYAQMNNNTAIPVEVIEDKGITNETSGSTFN